jgi:diacylglycerol kinase family enzyme
VTGGDYPQGRYFGNGVGLGFDTVVGFEAAKIKWLRGAASYLAALVKTIFLYSKAPVYEICLDGGAPSRKAFLMISIMNGTRMGGTFHMAPEGNPGDGLFDLCQVGQVPQAKILFVAAKFINGTQKEHPAVEMLRARQVTIRAIQGTIPAHADGETICTAGAELSIELFPAALTVVSSHHAG